MKPTIHTVRRRIESTCLQAYIVAGHGQVTYPMGSAPYLPPIERKTRLLTALNSSLGKSESSEFWPCALRRSGGQQWMTASAHSMRWIESTGGDCGKKRNVRGHFGVVLLLRVRGWLPVGPVSVGRSAAHAFGCVLGGDVETSEKDSHSAWLLAWCVVCYMLGCIACLFVVAVICCLGLQ